MTSGELARKTGVTLRTIRYYEELGFITPKAGTRGRRKSYGADALLAMCRIAMLKEAGMSLEQIAAILDEIAKTPSRAKARQRRYADVLEKAQAGVEQRIEDLREMEASIASALKSRNRCDRCKAPDCKGCSVFDSWSRFGLDPPEDTR